MYDDTIIQENVTQTLKLVPAHCKNKCSNFTFEKRNFHVVHAVPSVSKVNLGDDVT